MSTAQHWVPNRRARGRWAPVASRNEGYQRARKVWVCQHCRRWHEAGAKPVACEGCGALAKKRALLFFDSAGEAQRFMHLWMLQDNGRLSRLRHHHPFELVTVTEAGERVVIGRYVPDADYLDEHGERVVEDWKPRDPAAQDPVFRWKARHFAAQYGITVTVVS